jgi:lycopene cyclase domain-containing protein
MSGLGYTLPAIVALIAVIAAELAKLRTGLFGKVEYWISMGIVVAFQVIVDGWLTKLSAPIVIYNEQHNSGMRFPWDIPVEDFVFGWAMVTAVLLLWETQRPTNGGQR